MEVMFFIKNWLVLHVSLVHFSQLWMWGCYSNYLYCPTLNHTTSKSRNRIRTTNNCTMTNNLKIKGSIISVVFLTYLSQFIVFIKNSSTEYLVPHPLNVWWRNEGSETSSIDWMKRYMFSFCCRDRKTFRGWNNASHEIVCHSLLFLCHFVGFFLLIRTLISCLVFLVLSRV